jgi:hypothetical protein
MITIKKLKEKLALFNENLSCYAYEGEITGLIIIDEESKIEKGTIYCSTFFDENDIEPDFLT